MRTRKVIVEPPWQHMENAHFEGDPNDPVLRAMEDEPDFVGVFLNNLYQVTYRDVPTMMFSLEGEPPKMVAWLTIRRRDSAAAHDWRHLQNIKNDLCGPEYEAMEIYPAESRLVDASNQYHLWVLPKGSSLPFGYIERDVSDKPFMKNKQRPFADPPKDLNAKIKGLDIKDVRTLRTKMKQPL